MRYVEDPSIASAAKQAAGEMFDELCRLRAAGEQFFIARERVIAAHGPKLARECGKETARRALTAITALGPADMPALVRRAADDCTIDDMLQLHIDQHGPGYHYTAFQRWVFRVFGMLGAPRRVRGAGQPLVGAELEAWRALAAERRQAEAGMEIDREDAEAENAYRERAKESEINAFLRRTRRRIERGDVPRDVPQDEQDVRAFLRGEKPLIRKAGKAAIVAAIVLVSLAGDGRSEEILPRGSRICTEPIAGGSCVQTGRDVRILPSADPGRVYVPGHANPVFVRKRGVGEEGGLRPFGK